MIALLLMAFGLVRADGELRTQGLPNLVEGATVEASSSAAAPDAKYGINSAIDGDLGTWWASADHPRYPIAVRITFTQPTALDTLAIIQAENPTIYTYWKDLRLTFSDGSTHAEGLPDSGVPLIIRFERRTVEWVEVEITEAYDPGQHYVTLTELSAFSDPERKVGVRMPPTEAWKRADLTPEGRPEHPCVYVTPADVQRARTRVTSEPWASRWLEATRKRADEWLARDDAWFASVMPAEGACFAYGFTGCPICDASWGTWGGARCSFDSPAHVTCANGHVLPDADHPDPGTGYRGPDGRIHYFVGSYNSWVVETLQFEALEPLAHAYTLTGDERYAAKVAHILDLIAGIYPSCDAGSWDYPSNPPSGRLCRPWYQVARVLIHFVDWYDQVFASPALDQPSVRPGLTRRQNIEVNLLQNGGRYCYEQSLHGRLHNGEADYIRGALAVGCCLGIPWYIDWAYDGPYGILSMVRNNADRDGQYFETSMMYADHTRTLYLTFAEPLLNYRSAKYPQGINLYDDPQYQGFNVFPQLSFQCLGKSPRFGDSGPDTARSYLPDHLMAPLDYQLAERLFARVSRPEDRARFASLLHYLSQGDITRLREERAEMPWLLFHGADAPTGGAPPLDALLGRRLNRCDFLGQKGVGILRSGTGPWAQAALMRFGPTLNHGHLDDLNLNYYALGYELTHDLGYGLGSTHTQVGWARQTASHNLVLVNETPQGTDGSGTGGSLHLFADLPGLKLMEASSEASYAAQGVTTYRRLVALVGDGAYGYLADIFRVVGGNQHDYLLHSLTDQASFSAVELAAPEPGSLGGPDLRWGELQLNDGDMAGHPGAPYWNPPPANGLGFLMAPQRGTTDGTWTATWPTPEGDGGLRLTMLGQPGTEVISAWAPGILPTYPKARHAVARRRGENLASTFAAVLEPFGRDLEGQSLDAEALRDTATATAGEVRLLPDLGILLHKAEQADDELRWPFEVAEEGDYALAVDHYQSPLYGRVQLLVDDQPVGDLLTGTAAVVGAAPMASCGQVHLTAGRHSAALRAVVDDGRGHFWFGLRAVWLLPAAEGLSLQPRAFIRVVEAVACDPEDGPVRPTGLYVDLGETADLILSASDADRERAFRHGDRTTLLQGALAHVRTDAGGPVELHLVGSTRLRWGSLDIRCAAAEHVGDVRATDDWRAVFETDAKLPSDGRLDGQVILFENPLYSRNTAYRVSRIEPLADGSRVVLESPSFVLGTGIVEDEPPNDHEVVSLLPHEYARSDSGTGTQFLSGKLIDGEGFRTRIVRTAFGQLLRLEVETTQGMHAASTFRILDVQRGDTFRIPTLAHLQRSDEGGLTGWGTTEVTVLRDGQPVATIAPKGSP